MQLPHPKPHVPPGAGTCLLGERLVITAGTCLLGEGLVITAGTSLVRGGACDHCLSARSLPSPQFSDQQSSLCHSWKNCSIAEHRAFQGTHETTVALGYERITPKKIGKIGSPSLYNT